jgi:hypothetical protein
LQTVQVNGTPERAFTEGGSNTEAYFLSVGGGGGAKSCGKLRSKTSTEREEIFFAASVVFSTRVPCST